MNCALEVIILAANNNMDGEGAFWIQLLVLIILGVVVGVGSLLKTRAKRFKSQNQHVPEDAASAGQRRRRIESFRELQDKYVEKVLKPERPKTVVAEPLFDFGAVQTASDSKDIRKTEKKDLASGMEILELDFLLNIVKKTKGRNKKDVMMRTLAFNELIRREQLAALDSKILNFYTINKGGVYEKNVQCAAMKVLAERTKSRIEHSVR